MRERERNKERKGGREKETERDTERERERQREREGERVYWHASDWVCTVLCNVNVCAVCACAVCARTPPSSLLLCDLCVSPDLLCTEECLAQ